MDDPPADSDEGAPRLDCRLKCGKDRIQCVHYMVLRSGRSRSNSLGDFGFVEVGRLDLQVVTALP
jgi:hypothetical protein